MTMTLLLLLGFSISEVPFEQGKIAYTGFLDFWVDQETARVYLSLPKEPLELLYQSSLPQGIGSNDVGLDRGQLSAMRLVRFEPIGDKVLLRQLNTRFRANSEDTAERRAVEEAFAESVLWGFKVVHRTAGRILVDATDFVLRDSHGIARRLEQMKQGSFAVDGNRSALYLPRCKAFPRNTELEAIVTLVGEGPGEYVRQVTPDPHVISVRTHHSFIALPDDGYRPRVHHPQSGFWWDAHADYAAPLGEDMTQRWIGRHRLQKIDPAAAVSDVVDPIVYYLDPGVPEPVRGALLEGAGWWAEAFEAAGFSNAFRVEMLPEGADPMDVRYNVIQWVHRATRGWSYGFGVTDPRTGEIIKGHVTLGSLRVRQDFMIAQGMTLPFVDEGAATHQIAEMALARIRQLSAHEVGHTLGLDHNFAASARNRASVMDYPHPRFGLDATGKVTLNDAYARGVGAWDKRAIIYGYREFGSMEQERAGLELVLQKTRSMGLEFANDADARSLGSCHPRAHLWDNGGDALQELGRLIELRAQVLAEFDARAVPFGQPIARLEDVLVPVYLLHRYQVQAVGALIGGSDYVHELRSAKPPTLVKAMPAETQEAAIDLLAATLTPSFLVLRDELVDMIPPQPPGYARGRENVEGFAGRMFDPVALAEASASLSLDVLLEPSRLARMRYQHARNPSLPSSLYLMNLLANQLMISVTKGMESEIQDRLLSLFTTKMIHLFESGELSPEVRADVFEALSKVREWARSQMRRPEPDPVHRWLNHLIDRAIETDIDLSRIHPHDPPPGSPIGN